MRQLLFLPSLLLLSIQAASAAPIHWKVDYSRSKVGFTVNWGGEPFHGVFRSWKANIEFDPADLAHSRADISIETGSEASGDTETDEGVKGAEGFAASQFPTAQFRTTAFTHKSGDAYVATGTLSIKGISRPITLPFTLTLSGNSAGVIGKAAIVRTDFQVGTGEWARSDPVAQAVTVNIEISASKG